MKKISEDILINYFKKLYKQSGNTKIGIGDDCAVLKTRDQLIITTDTIVDGTHFLLDKVTGYDIGWKALGCNVSDIAAMGGKPIWATVSMGIPLGFEKKAIDISHGIHAIAQKFKVDVVGGDIVRSKTLFVNTTVIGRPFANKPIFRIGSRIGDKVLVTGELGGSRWGKHMRFVPRIRESKWLVRNYDIHSMIDVSDGLYKDIRRLLSEGQGVELEDGTIPISSIVLGKEKVSLESALYDGEDFELLFSVGPKTAKRIMKEWPFRDVKVSIIGRIVSSKRGRVFLKKGKKRILLQDKGYEHFSS